jgi:multiple sugar transport system substrate-binding protein
MTVTLRGLCWDHPRCTRPMAAASLAYRTERPEISVAWDARPLALFNDQPVWEIEAGYDLVYVDHPMTGASAEREALVALDTVLSADTLARIADESIGASHASYRWNGHQWALGVDAVTQVAALRTDRLERLAGTVPRTWDDVLDLASRAPGSVAMPLYPSDAMCSLISLSANSALAAGEPATWLREDAAQMLVDLVGLVGPSCFDLNPPALLDRLSGVADCDDGVAYVPFVFGYANLSRPPLAFTDVAGVDGQPRGAILGGAGLAVPPTSKHILEATEFAAWCMGATVQRDVLLPAAAQPGNRLVWDDPTAVAATSGYLRDTRRSIDQAYVRPRGPWWPRFQRQAGQRLVGLLRDKTPARRIVADLESLADQHQAMHHRAAALTTPEVGQ